MLFAEPIDVQTIKGQILDKSFERTYCFFCKNNIELFDGIFCLQELLEAYDVKKISIFFLEKKYLFSMDHTLVLYPWLRWIKEFEAVAVEI